MQASMAGRHSTTSHLHRGWRLRQFMSCQLLSLNQTESNQQLHNLLYSIPSIRIHMISPQMSQKSGGKRRASNLCTSSPIMVPPRHTSGDGGTQKHRASHISNIPTPAFHLKEQQTTCMIHDINDLTWATRCRL